MNIINYEDIEDELVNTFSFYGVLEWYEKNKNAKGVISLETSGSAWGFSEMITSKFNMTFPARNYTYDVKNGLWDFNIRNVENNWRYTTGLMLIEFLGTVIKIYDKERTFIDIYKKYKTNRNEWFFMTCYNFFVNTKYDSNKLIEYAMKFNVLDEIELLRGVYGIR